MVVWFREGPLTCGQIRLHPMNMATIWSKIPQEGDTYAFWTQEGGIALMHILDIKYRRKSRIDHILFDWVYYPPFDRSPDATSIQPTSWGELKNSLLRTK